MDGTSNVGVTKTRSVIRPTERTPTIEPLNVTIDHVRGPLEHAPSTSTATTRVPYSRLAKQQ